MKKFPDYYRSGTTTHNISRAPDGSTLLMRFLSILHFPLIAPPPLKTLTLSKTLTLIPSARRLSTLVPIPMDPAATEDALRKTLAEKQAAVNAQADAVRSLKSRPGVVAADVEAAVAALNALKIEHGAAARRLQAAVNSNGGEGSVNREALRMAVVNTLERRLFYMPSFKIYRGVAGLYDYGPPGCAVKSNVLAFWRQVIAFDFF